MVYKVQLNLLFLFQMLENHGNISRAFVAFDKRGDGFVTLDELKRVLLTLPFQCQTSCLLNSWTGK